MSPRSGAACLMLPPHLFQKGRVRQFPAVSTRTGKYTLSV
ncbi:hypothetical protein SLI_4580 [Streptomyces lividans 1326]|uniref:Uncharacterized protein n=1 Tax=Streptomyces lividans 1326 TaxID=1200984 RepID=A0A7U9HC46_STRLI|nr:hypothetical protein SLI_4580 [Streptomyces lividans 1326]